MKQQQELHRKPSDQKYFQCGQLLIFNLDILFYIELFPLINTKCCKKFTQKSFIIYFMAKTELMYFDYIEII